MLGLGLSIVNIAVLQQGGISPPTGFVFLLDADLFAFTDADGARYVEAA